MIDKQGKILGKVSVIDLFVLAMIIAIVLFGVFRLGNTQGMGILQTAQPVTLGFVTIDPTEDFTARVIRVGDPVVEHEAGARLGHVTAVSKQVTMEQHPNVDGIMTASPLHGYYQVNITTTLHGYPVDNGLRVMGHLFLVGDEIVIRAGDANLFVYVSEITVD